MREPIAREIIFAIGDNMRHGLEPLLNKTLAPSLYQVYLHADDFERIRTILPQIEAQAKEHLDLELQELGSARPPALERARAKLPLRLRGRRAKASGPMKFEPAAGDWSIRFAEDPNAHLEPGEIEVVSELAFGDAPDYGSGSPTQRIEIATTRRLGASQTDRRPAVGPERVSSPMAAFAVFRFRDDAGDRTFEMTQDEIVIGRDSSDADADLRLRTLADVSRRHIKVRRQPSTGGFWIQDLSQYGTEVNGRSLPRGVEVELPDAARISLAAVVTLEFASSRSGR